MKAKPDSGSCLFAAVTPIIILFEAGLSLDLDVIRGWIRSTLSLTLIKFFLTMAAVAIAAHFLLGLGFRLTLMFGAIVGSISPAVIVPLARRMHMEQSSKTILFLESAISDVLSIVVAIGFMDSYKLVGLLRRIRGLENSIFTMPGVCSCAVRHRRDLRL
jgi:potassium/hydrogen antiporter